MQAAGFRLSANPDLILNLDVVVKRVKQMRETDVRKDINYIGQRRYLWESEEQVVGVYDGGDMTIDFVDAEKNKSDSWISYH
jgi:hypothetical protein